MAFAFSGITSATLSASLTPARMFGMPCGYPYSVLRKALRCNVLGLPCCQ